MRGQFCISLVSKSNGSILVILVPFQGVLINILISLVANSLLARNSDSTQKR